MPPNLITSIPWIAPHARPSTPAHSKERKGSNFAIWQPCAQALALLLRPLLRTQEFGLHAIPPPRELEAGRDRGGETVQRANQQEGGAKIKEEHTAFVESFVE